MDENDLTKEALKNNLETYYIIASLNKLNAYADFYTGEHKYVNNYYKNVQKEIEQIQNNCSKKFKFLVAQKLEDVIEAVNKYNEKHIVIFSNFPANNSYKRYKVSKEGYTPDSYDYTLREYEKLLSDFPNLELHIVTGSPRSMIPDEKILKIGKNISLIRLEDIKKTAKGSNYSLIEYFRDFISEFF